MDKEQMKQIFGLVHDGIIMECNTNRIKFQYEDYLDLVDDAYRVMHNGFIAETDSDGLGMTVTCESDWELTVSPE